MERIDDNAAPAASEPSEGPNPGTRPEKANGVEDTPPPIAGARIAAAAAAIVADQAEEQLRDIGEASFPLPANRPRPGPRIRAEDIIGEDQRTPITATSVYPYRAIASLLIVAADGKRWSGTGFFITPRTLVTAGHCVWIKNRGQVQSIEVIPGRNGKERPFGSAVSRTFHAPPEWTEDGKENHDYGVIILDTPLGERAGTFGVGVYTREQLSAVTANISGYPGGALSGTQWFHSRKLKEIMAERVFYDVDTEDGQSGAPVWRIINRRRYAFAIHTYGGTSRNSGTRITAAVHENLMAWKQ